MGTNQVVVAKMVVMRLGEAIMSAGGHLEAATRAWGKEGKAEQGKDKHEQLSFLLTVFPSTPFACNCFMCKVSHMLTPTD